MLSFVRISRVVAPVVAVIALIASAAVASAAVLTVHVNGPTPTVNVCGQGIFNGDTDSSGNPTFQCAITAHGNVTDASAPGTYDVKLTIDVSNNVGSFPPLCFAPVTGPTNLTQITFNDAQQGTITLKIDTFCLGPDATGNLDTSGPITGTFTVTGGTCNYNAATGAGDFNGSWSSTSAGGFPINPLLVTFTFNQLTSTPKTCGGGGGGGGNATPELDSLLLFGSGLGGGVSYLLMRRRANRS